MNLKEAKKALLYNAKKEKNYFLKGFLEHAAKDIRSVPKVLSKDFIVNTTSVHVKALSLSKAESEGFNELIENVRKAKPNDSLLWINSEFNDWMGRIILRVDDGEVIGVALIKLEKKKKPIVPKNWDGREESLVWPNSTVNHHG